MCTQQHKDNKSCHTSNQCKNDPPMKVQWDAALADHMEWKQKMTARAEQRNKFEIEVRYDDLKKKNYRCAHTIATGRYSDCFYCKFTPHTSQLSKEEYTTIVASRLISRFPDKQAKVFGFKEDKPMTIDGRASAAAATTAATVALTAKQVTYLSEPMTQ